MPNLNKITIISCGIGPAAAALPKELLAATDILAGSRRLLAEFPDFAGEKVALTHDAAVRAAALVTAAAAGQPVTVLASGDALFHGIGGTILRLIEESRRPIELEIRPAPTAFQELFAKLALPWDEARCFSFHRGQEPSLREILDQSLAVIYGGSSISTVAVATRLVEISPIAADRPAILAENLGRPEESIRRGCLGEIATWRAAPLSILLLLPAGKEITVAAPPLALGLDNQEYAPENGLITNPEIRAAALARLRLPAAGVLWDIGAGSGSVGLEAAALRSGLQVYGVEQNEKRVKKISAAAGRLGIGANYSIIPGAAPAVLAGLPEPARVFIGGGGAGLGAILDTVYERLAPGALIVVSAITLEALALLHAWRPESCVDGVRIEVSRLCSLAGRYRYHKAENGIELMVYRKGR